LDTYAPIENKCECITTKDVKDFYFIDIEVISGESFVEQYFTRETGHFKAVTSSPNLLLPIHPDYPDEYE
jgi:hypothetical protein